MRELLYPEVDFKHAYSNYKLSYNPLGYMFLMCIKNRKKKCKTNAV